MNRTPDAVYRYWLRQSSQGTPRRAAAGDARGMGQSPMFTLPRETGPTTRGTYSPARPGAVGALSMPSNGAFERSIEHQVPPRGAKAANDSSYSRHEKPVFDYVDNANEDYYPEGGR